MKLFEETAAMKLNEAFYQRDNVTEVARDLLGKVVFTRKHGIVTGGMIVETEAYSWRERGCHAFGARKTGRNAVMFNPGGLAYVYLCYGIHDLFNVVTNKEDVPEAVLIRAVEPVTGVNEMKRRRNAAGRTFHLTSGPGKLTRALGIDRSFNGKSLTDDEIWIEDTGTKVASKNIEASERIGIDYAGDDARLPWRFTLKGNAWVSK